MTARPPESDAPSESGSAWVPRSQSPATSEPGYIGNQASVSRVFPRDLTTVILLITFAVITHLFYTTDFRNSLESFFFDKRVQLMPISKPSNKIVVITIDDQSIADLETDPLRRRTDSKKRPYLSTKNMTKTASILSNTEATAIGLLMPEQAFPASDLDMSEIRDIVKFDPRIIIGTTGYNQTIPNLNHLPPVLSEISAQVAGYETFRSRSNAVIRSLPYTGYRGLTESEMLPSRLAGLAVKNLGTGRGFFLLKHHDPSYFPAIAMSDFVKSPIKYMDALKDKVIIVGYTVPRDAGFQTTEQMMANTPLTGAAATNAQGISTTWLIANATDNLITGDFIHTAPGTLTMAQTAIVAAACGLAWEFGSLFASVATLILWISLIVLHSLIFRYLNLSIPLADTFLATVLVTVFAAIRRMKTELMIMAGSEANAGAKAEIAAVQSRFLSGFAKWLKTTTGVTVNLIRESQSNADADKLTQDIYNRAYAAGEDFSEYLESIAQIPAMEAISNRQLKKHKINLSEMIMTIVRRFEIKTATRGITIKTDFDPNASSLTSAPQLIDAIIFNLISNAVKYSPDNTTVIIKTRRSDRKEMYIAVIDSGPGIPRDLHERIFERFYRIRDDRMYNAKGSGIGLYLCRFFSEKIGGRIDVISEPGHGSEFRLVLP